MIRTLVSQRRTALTAVFVLTLASQGAWTLNALPAPQDVSAVAPAPEAGADYMAQREEIFDAFYKTGLDTSTAYTVSNLALVRDSMTLLLKRGTVFFMPPIAREPTGAVFLGEGEAMMNPPNRTERYMLRRFAGSNVLREPFTEAVLRFSDGSYQEIVAAGRPEPTVAAQAGRAAQILTERNALLDVTRELRLETQFLESRVSGLQGQDFFLAEIHTTGHDWLTYRHDPQEINEHSLGVGESSGSQGRRYLVPWMEWHDTADYGPKGYYQLPPERDGPRTLAIRHQEMTLNLKNTKTVEWDVRLRIEPLTDGLRCLRFDLDNNADYLGRWYSDDYAVRVAAVTDEQGSPLAYMHRKDALLVFLPQPALRGSPLTLRVRGAADVIYQITAESFGLLQVAWYPQYGFLGGQSTFRWTVRVPKPFLVTGSGRFVREETDQESDQNVLETSSDRPIFFPWVIFGRFQKAQSTYSSAETRTELPMTLHSFPYMTFTITDREILDRYNLSQPLTLSFTAPPKKIDGLFAEGKEILKLYEKIYGPYPYDELHIAQMGPFLGYGQAPQGFVQMTGEAFMSQAVVESDFFHGFFAHEIAHQWWGHQITWGSQDDEWLSEAFAEYAAGIFVKEYQGAKRFQRTLEEWKRIARMSDPAAPIAAANSLRSRAERRHRGGLLYSKGPYVLHMLRIQLGDEMYVKVMRHLHATFQGRSATTEMVIREINRATGADYTVFFDQWFYDTGIPKFRYSWRSERQPDGKFLVVVRVSQEDKDRLKKVIMPVHLHFKDRSIPQYKPVVEAEQDIRLLVPVEPKDVTLDDDHTLLADIAKAS